MNNYNLHVIHPIKKNKTHDNYSFLKNNQLSRPSIFPSELEKIFKLSQRAELQENGLRIPVQELGPQGFGKTLCGRNPNS